MTQTLTSGHSRLVLFSPQQKRKRKIFVLYCHVGLPATFPNGIIPRPIKQLNVRKIFFYFKQTENLKIFGTLTESFKEKASQRSIVNNKLFCFKAVL